VLPSALKRSDFVTIFRCDDGGAQRLLRTDENCILGSNFLGEVVGKKSDFDTRILKAPQAFSGNPLVGNVSTGYAVDIF
jgi:hypothetical protein